jgi:PLP dependent protein
VNSPDADARTREIAANLAEVRERIATACAAAGREASEVALIAVTKTFPAADVRRLVALGVTDVAENRDQEARGKAAELAGEQGLRWHFVGRLQRNKVNHVVAYADVVHSVDRAELADALAASARRGRTGDLDVLVQVNLEPDQEHRGGVAPDRLPALAEHVAGATGLRLAGLMAVAPLGADPEPAFAVLADLAARLRADHPAATMLSAGMSADLETAIAHGTTHVRVGTALLGGRARPVG